MSNETAPSAPVSGVAAGVPYVAIPPSGPSGALGPSVPLVVAWHLMDPPRTEAAFAAALPMRDLNAWRIYLGLPMCGARLPSGGSEELMRLAFTDAVLNVYDPIARQGTEEFPAALRAVRKQLGLEDRAVGPVGLVGGSMGSAIAALSLIETAPAAGIEVAAVVLISPVAQLRAVVDAVARRYHATYPWHPEATRIAERLDFVARAAEIAAVGQPAVRLIVGAEDDREGFLEPAQRLRAALAERYVDPSRIDAVVIPEMGHALAEEPGIAPAPQTAQAVAVDRHTVTWLQKHLTGRTP